MKQFFKPQLKKTMTSVYTADGMIKMSNSLEMVYDEIDNWSRISNDNIVKMHEFIDDKKCTNMYIIMDLCDLGQISNWNNELKKYIRNQKVIDSLSNGKELDSD